MTPTSTLQLACPTCGDEIEIEYEVHYDSRTTIVGGDEIEIYPDSKTTINSLRTWCFDAISREDAYRLLMNEGARQAELATEGER